MTTRERPESQTGSAAQFVLGERLEVKFWIRGTLDSHGVFTVGQAGTSGSTRRPRLPGGPVVEASAVRRIVWPNEVAWPRRYVGFLLNPQLVSFGYLDVDGVLTITKVGRAGIGLSGPQFASERDVTKLVWAEGVEKPEGFEDR